MANTIKIKRSTTTATPTSLAEGELAYSENSNNLFIGTSGSNIANIGGKIGVTVQGYDANTAKYDDTTANFTGTLQNGGSNVVVDTDIGSTVQEYDANIVSDASYVHTDNNFTSALKSNYDAAYSWYNTMTTADGDSVINTVTEIVSAFENHAEGLNLITELDAKLTASSTIDGGTF